MAIGTPTLLKQNQIDATNQGSIPIALTTGASAGDLVVVMVAFGLGSSPTITCADNSGGGNTYVKDKQVDKTTSNTPHTAIFSCVLAGALTTSHTITVSFGTNVNFPLAWAYKVTGCAASSVLDQVNGGTGVSTSPASGSITTTQASEILFGFMCTGNPQALTAGSGWTLLANGSTSTKGLSAQYRIESATGTFTSDGTITSADWAMGIASYKGAGAATNATVTGVRAATTGTAQPGSPVVSLLGLQSAAPATAQPGSPVDGLLGTQAAATGTAQAGSPQVTIRGVQAAATATAQPGSASSVTTVTGVQASATAAGQAGTVSADTNITGAQASATATAQPGSPVVSLLGVQAAATATAQPGAPTTVVVLVVTGVQAAAAATANTGDPVVGDLGTQAAATATAQAGSPIITILGVQAAATGTAQAGSAAVTPSSARATATATAQPGTLSTTIVATGVRAAATATGQGGSPTVVIAGSQAAASASSIAGAVVLAVAGVAGTATAAAAPGTLFQTSTVAGSRAFATATATPGSGRQVAPPTLMWRSRVATGDGLTMVQGVRTQRRTRANVAKVGF